ncbi:hydroxymethylbilane synthase [Blochmannia endosymbiont of Camponotus sp. C-003]|uniref:hydroxymethylbilane synthase n=1 Tax=unclassified Candidatus Blochmanniella TaxID=711328 RepID=UPI00202573E8|nr:MULTISPECIES: hydroxymethylbilane synthase [unclassified Candidatus Blochmannia]URJ23269.1 hydroxymethylbilane synthase [Blochmannia endosymbiont of Camponotus sp. C-003]URJ28740.1 hydroxymethylbilane synthase [Blochmannia endosymbiont of Camponotus sp. C-046]
MKSKILKIATRKSRLAISQAQYVYDELKRYHPTLHIELMPIITTGDKFLNIDSKNKIKKGAFIKELEYALINFRADIAVHSMKDITVPVPNELTLPVLCKRNDPRDAFVSVKYPNMDTLPIGSTIGTSSLRRQCQIRAQRPDLVIGNLRGNIDTRLKKLQYGQYDAIVLAVAGLKRLHLHEYIRVYFDPSDLLPAMGQGVIAIECRSDDIDIVSLLSPLYHRETSLCVRAERAVTTYLESYCHLPIASYAEIKEDQVWLRALIGLPDGSKIIRTEGRAPLDQAEKLGFLLAEDLLIKFKQ